MPEPATYAELQPSMPDDTFIDARPSQSQVRGSSETRVLVVRRRVVLVRLVRNRSSKPKPSRSRKSPSSIPSPSSSSATASLPPFMPMSPTFDAAWHVSRPSSAIVSLETSMQTANDPQRTYEAEIWEAAPRPITSRSRKPRSRQHLRRLSIGPRPIATAPQHALPSCHLCRQWYFNKSAAISPAGMLALRFTNVSGSRRSRATWNPRWSIL